MTFAFLRSYLTLFCEIALSSQYNLVYKTNYLLPACDQQKKKMQVITLTPRFTSYAKWSTKIHNQVLLCIVADVHLIKPTSFYTEGIWNAS